jgi:transmembrane 9 superfamily protein 3
MYFVFTSFWGFKVYYVFTFLALVFLMLTMVTACVVIVCTYFLLNGEDYRWYNILPCAAQTAPLNVWLLHETSSIAH